MDLTQENNASTPKHRSKKRSNLFIRTMKLLNSIFILLLLASYIAPYVSPAHFWHFTFLGLTYPYLVLINFFFVLLWAILWRARFLYSLIAIIIGWSNLSNLFQLNLNASSQEKVKEKSIKVMSYNVRVFDLYNWSHSKETRNNIFNLFTEEEPDILCLQEFYTERGNRFKTLDTLTEFLKAKNAHTNYTYIKYDTLCWGIATFSKFPIVGKGLIDFKNKNNNNNGCIYTDILMNTDTVRVYNMHLQSIQFHKPEYKYMEDLMSNHETQEDIENSKNILRRLKRAYIKRASQADMIAEHISQSPYPVIVCGDFNDTPSSYTYHTIRNNLMDAFKECGNGLGQTYIGKFPSFRIDYILHDSKFKAFEYNTIHAELSDHYPITCYLNVE